MNVDVSIRTGDGSPEVSAITKDLSSGGVFLYTDSAFAVGSRIEMVLILPPEIAGGERKWACCQASVVRLENSANQKFGIAAAIDQIDVLPEIAG